MKDAISSILKFDGKFIKLHKVPVQHQAGGSDCGLFAIAFAVALCFGLNPSKLNFQQHKMGDHLLHCLAENKFTNFPFIINPNWKKKKIVTQNERIFFVLVEVSTISTTVRWQNAFPVTNGFTLDALAVVKQKM